MTLPITYADGNTIHGTDVDSWTETVNAVIALLTPSGYTLVAGFTTTATSGTAVTLTNTSTGVQVFTGSTAQTVNLPTTSVTAGQAWIVSNQSSATATVKASGGATVSTVAAGVTMAFVALTATPTTAAGWGTELPLVNPTINGYTETVQALGTVGATQTIGALTLGTVVTATLTASTATTFTMPTAIAGQSFTMILKQPASTGNGSATFTGVKWNSSGAPTITVTAGKNDILAFISDGTDWYGSYSQGYTY